MRHWAATERLKLDTEAWALSHGSSSGPRPSGMMADSKDCPVTARYMSTRRRWEGTADTT
eukprot:CAMPEP_0118984536 /NCGR_PEP_ID=MMETSP1173-20130426/37976_1 /TAXON_ID=1034831 /ORGANISM="Rhizochromulina marina cf, Strain CCMP1243" /LENGTH=59 /DNA_ID=CAMNT_0006935205 /DNA_START=67 /DNA_END=242 /DNA_ORIENTATION=-